MNSPLESSDESSSSVDVVAARAGTVPWRLDLLTALSFANLCFLNSWRELQQFFSPEAAYFGDGTFPWRLFGALLLDIAILGLIAWCVCWVWRRVETVGSRRLLAVLFLAAALWPASEVRLLILIVAKCTTPPLWLAPILYAPEGFIAVAIYGLFTYSDWRLARGLRTLLLVMSPLLLIQSGYVILNAINQLPLESGPVSREGRPAPKRLVLAIFDEWDWELTTAWRSEGLKLEGIDNLLRRSVVFTDARAPAQETLLSVPSMLSGRHATAYRVAGKDRLELRWDGSSGWRSWKDLPNLFTELHVRGVDSGVAGWFHPYCRLFSGELASCCSEPYGGALQKSSLNVLYAGEHGLLRSALLQAWERLAAIPWMSPFVPASWEARRRLGYRAAARKDTRSSLERLHREALALVGRPDLGFVLLHYPVPHPPGIYEEDKGAFTGTDAADYRGNLRLTSRLIAELEGALSESGLSGNTALVVTSDHPLRAEVWSSSYYWSDREIALLKHRSGAKVPVLIALPGAHGQALCDTEFHTILLHDLITRFFTADFPDNQSVLDWVRSRSERSHSQRSEPVSSNSAEHAF